MKIRIFYAGMLLEEFYTVPHEAFTKWRKSVTSEIYNRAYVFFDYDKPPHWYRLDYTPCLLSDVPKELQLLNLIL